MASEQDFSDVAPFPAFEETAPSSSIKAAVTRQETAPIKTSFEFHQSFGSSSNPSSGEHFDTTISVSPAETTANKSTTTPNTPDRTFSSTRVIHNQSSSPSNRYPHQSSTARIQNHRRSPRHNHHRAGQNHSASSPSQKPTVRECICGRGVACVGMTQAFRLLGDPRSYYVELPRYRKDPPAYKYVFRNRLRQAYIRQLVRQNPDQVNVHQLDEDQESGKRRFVALHHFHPAVVRAFYENPLTSAQKHKVPISITEHELEELNMEILSEDQILSASGMATGGYYFVPSYPHQNAHNDLKTLIQAVRTNRGGKSGRNHSKQRSNSSSSTGSKPVPTDIQIKPKSSNSTAETTTTMTTTATKSEELETRKQGKDQHLFADETFNDNVFASFKNQDEPSSKDDITVELVAMSTSNAPSEMAKIYANDENVFRDTIGMPLNQNDDAEFEPFPPVNVGEDGLTSITEEFDRLWGKSSSREIETNLFSETIFEEENEAGETDDDGDAVGRTESETIESSSVQVTSQPDAVGTELSSLASKRSSDRDRPWETPKYRRDRPKDEDPAKRLSGPAAYIDPTSTGDLTMKLSQSASLDDGDDIARIAADMTIYQPGTLQESPTEQQEPSKPNVLSRTNSLDSHILQSSSGKASQKPKKRFDFSEEDGFSVDSGDSGMSGGISGAIYLNHQLPGSDPTLRIQVHNDLIAWESKRRSDLAQQLEYHRERWQAAVDILIDGINETQCAERLILGISKASKLFADSLRAVYDDKLLDDRGNTVKNSFLQNRLAKQRSKFEYSIEAEDSTQSKQSMLLDSIVEAQLQVAKAFIDNTAHMEEEILPEIADLKAETTRESRKLELVGESIIAELKRSEIEVKNIWDVFDAMVTGDLMEYTVHGSTHGGSSHGGGSFHSSSLTGGSGTIQGFLTPMGDNEAPIVSSVHSPLVKSTFRQLGGVEDGWLIEMYYKSSVAYQRSVFGAAEMEFKNLFQEISVLEERRYRKLHQLMLAFAPRQRRLYNQLPDHLKVVLENLVGLRIDEESLQKILDESVKDRSRDHLRGSTAHKSSILNRSRVNAQPDASAENEIELMETTFGSPFASPMILLSKVVELKPTGLKSLVNNAWKPALAVVTSEGHLVVFETPDTAKTPTEAFKSLYPPMNFDDNNTWITGRKAEIVKSLTPSVSLKLTRCTLIIPPMRKSQLEITEEKQQSAPGGTAKSRFMNAVKSTAQQSKCTLRVTTATEANEWANLLERTKKVLLSQAAGRGSRFRF